MGNLSRLFGYLRPYVVQLLLGALLLTVSGALMAAVVSTFKPLINDVLLAGAERSAPSPGPDILGRLERFLPAGEIYGWLRENAFVQVPLLIVALFGVKGVFLYFGQYLTVRAGARVIRDLRVELYEAVAHQSATFFQAHPTGLILSRILNDVQRLHKMSTTALADLIRVGAMVPFLVLIALIHDWRMSLVAFVGLPLLGYPAVRLGRKLRRASTRSQENMADIANRLTEAVVGVRVVQGFGMEHYEVGRFREAVERMLQADLRAARAQSLSPAVVELVGAVIGAALFFVAGRTIAAGDLDAGNFTVVVSSLGMLFMSVGKMNRLYAEVQKAMAAGDRVFDMLDREREIRDLPGAEALPGIEREIRFEDVRFSYGDENVLDGIDLVIPKGEVVALVGASGSGKSTLASLLPRFYDPTDGRIAIDGRDIRHATLATLRAQIGIVTQETVLFDDTVRGNIAYGRADVPLERVREAARAAHAEEFVRDLPEGYETMLGERGTRLSVGQRQRITIARALLKSPPILILDEATSALDAESEALVQRALEALMKGRTSIVIAHRLSTVRRADRILVMDGGRIVEQGSHGELLARDGTYARLYALQFREANV